MKAGRPALHAADATAGKAFMKDEQRKKIEEIIAGMRCTKNFRCAESGFERLCEAEDTGLEGYVKCHDDDPSVCSFALLFGGVHFCRCPLRVYLAKELKK